MISAIAVFSAAYLVLMLGVKSGSVMFGILMAPAYPFLAFSLTLHELSHGGAALAIGQRIHGIGLGPWSGGLVVMWRNGRRRYFFRPHGVLLTRIPLDPRKRIIVARAGPGGQILLGLCLLIAALLNWHCPMGHWWEPFSRFGHALNGLALGIPGTKAIDILAPLAIVYAIIPFIEAGINLLPIKRKYGNRYLHSDGMHALKAWREIRAAKAVISSERGFCSQEDA